MAYGTLHYPAQGIDVVFGGLEGDPFTPASLASEAGQIVGDDRVITMIAIAERLRNLPGGVRHLVAREERANPLSPGRALAYSNVAVNRARSLPLFTMGELSYVPNQRRRGQLGALAVIHAALSAEPPNEAGAVRLRSVGVGLVSSLHDVGFRQQVYSSGAVVMAGEVNEILPRLEEAVGKPYVVRLAA
jgi:hypothetical protein